MNLSAGSGAPVATSDPLEAGCSAFNRGDYFLAHELWEEVWREMPGPPASSGRDERAAAASAETGAPGAEGDPIPVTPTKVVVQGLIQIAAGCHHLRNHRPEPGVRLLKKGLTKLEFATTVASAGAAPGVDVASLVFQPSRIGAFAGAIRALARSWSGGPSLAELDLAESDLATLKF